MNAREKARVAPTREKMVESRLRWFGHVRRRSVKVPVTKANQMESSPTVKRKERPRIIIVKTIKKNLYLNGMFIDMIYNITQWRHLTNITFLSGKKLGCCCSCHFLYM